MRSKQHEVHRPKDSAATRNDILRAAAQQFARHGYAHVTLQEIADDAGVTPALINRYFVSKRALFERVAQSHSSFVELTVDLEEFAGRLMAYWQDVDRRTPALALVRSIDLDDGKLLKRELERRLREPWREFLAGDDEATAKIRLLESLTMGLGLFGFNALLDEGTVEDDSPEVRASMLRRLTRMVAACLDD
ncbi:helix-turn-helix domain-containing protein [Streptomyces sp. NPDC088847]|uniref:TetR/AcrR family transcriptional regulator n=1 Tax=Streptomyces sp. NPDC088847 TaxID=3365909 RepID=UPI003829FC22